MRLTCLLTIATEFWRRLSLNNRAPARGLILFPNQDQQLKAKFLVLRIRVPAQPLKGKRPVYQTGRTSEK